MPFPTSPPSIEEWPSDSSARSQTDLRLLPHLEEVNFWAPSATPFKALTPGELFLFKLHAPDNFIVGGGVFAYANVHPCSLAWEAFGEANGASSLLPGAKLGGAGLR
jgi:hypothetical protein